MLWRSVSQPGYCEEPWKKGNTIRHTVKNSKRPLIYRGNFCLAITNTGVVTTLFVLFNFLQVEIPRDIKCCYREREKFIHENSR
jgi:hypothetical protein